MERFAFAWYLTHWKEDLIWPFRVCLKSLDLRGGAAASYPRYLVFSGEINEAVTGFCADHSLQIIPKERWTLDFGLPNRTLVCSVPAHEVVCLIDTDIVFLGSPQQLFESCASAGKLFSRTDICLPYSRLTEKAHLANLALKLWKSQYRRFRADGHPAVEVPHASGGFVPPYFNGGVHFVPGRYLQQLGARWQEICSHLYRDSRYRRPYTFLFQSYYFEMMSFALAIHSCGIPWEQMSNSHNFMPVPHAPASDKSTGSQHVVMLHLVKEMRHWLDPDLTEQPVEFLPLWNQVREILNS